MSFYLLEQYVAVRVGEPYRLFPFGTIKRQDKEINFTPELAAKFKLPHFKPPIKLGSHKDETPAGGFIVGLEVRGDGLYAVPEYNEQGMAALERGDYRYHSPEIVWSGVWGEDAITGNKLEGPMILGDAMLHSPALGEAAALYSVEPFKTEGDTNMADDNQDMVSLSMIERLKDLFGVTTPEVPGTVEIVEQDDQPDYVQYEAYEAELQKRDETIDALQDRIAKMEAENDNRERREHFAAELQDTPYSTDSDFIDVLTALTDEQAAPVVEKIRALSAQVDQSLTDEIGGQGHGDEVAAFNAAVAKIQEEKDVGYNEAISELMKTQKGANLYHSVNGGVA